MILRNPFLHYPKYVARIIFTDGSFVKQKGTSLSEIKFSYDEKDVVTICWEAMEANDVCKGTAMYYDGAWREYDKELVDRLEHPITSPPAPESHECSPPVKKTKKKNQKPINRKVKKITQRTKSTYPASKTPMVEYKSIENSVNKSE